MDGFNRRVWMLVVLAAALILVAVGAWFAVATDGADTATVMIDERTGSYRGIRFGTAERDVIRALGTPDRTPGFAPAGENPSEVGVPEFIPAKGPGGLLKYEGVGFLGTPDDGVYAFIVTDAGATTRRGVSIGDRMDVARSKYKLACRDVAGGESLFGGHEFYPSCSGRLNGGTRIWFGRDPIRSITLLSGTFGAGS